MSAEDDLIRAEDTKQLLRNPAYIAVFKAMEKHVVDRLSEIDIPPEKTVRLQALLAATKMLERHLKNYLITGKFIEEEHRRATVSQRVSALFSR